MGPAKQIKRSVGFKCKVIQLANENGKIVGYLMLIFFHSIREWKRNKNIKKFMPKNKCVLINEVTKLSILEQSFANGVLENQ